MHQISEILPDSSDAGYIFNRVDNPAWTQREQRNGRFKLDNLTWLVRAGAGVKF